MSQKLMRSTFVDLLQMRAAQEPNRLAYAFALDQDAGHTHWTYSELNRKARAIAVLLQHCGAASERVLLLYPAGLEYVAALFGCFYAGAIAVPVYPPRPNRSLARLTAILADARPKVALTVRQVLANIQKQLGDKAFDSLSFFATDAEPTDPDLWRHPDIASETLALIQYTSGSTSMPRGVMLSHGNLLDNSRSIQQSFGTSQDDKGVIWIPPYHDMGLIGGILQPAYAGFPVTLMTPAAFLQRPRRWLQIISETKGTVSGGPNFAFDLCMSSISPQQREDLDLSSWRVAFCGAEPIRHDVLSRFADYFAPVGFRPDALYPCYGLAEATLIVSGAKTTDAIITPSFDAQKLQLNRIHPVQAGESARTLVGCGAPAENTEVLIVDHDSRVPSAVGAVGEIWVRGPGVAIGYWNQRERTRDIFHACCADGRPETYLRTGDLGFLHQGQVFVAGRLKDLIIIRGKNHYPQDIEATAERSHESLVPNAAAAFLVELNGSEKLVLMQEIKRKHRGSDMNAIVRGILREVAAEHEIDVDVIAFVNPLSLPKTSSGKIQRHACKQAWLSEKVSVVHIWTRTTQEPEAGRPVLSEGSPPQRTVLRTECPASAIQAWLVSRISQLTGLDPSQIGLREPFTSFGLDSVKSVMVSSEFSEWMDRQFSPTLLWDYPTIEHLVSHIAANQPRSPEQNSVEHTGSTADSIAVVGLGCRFPGAVGPDEFWEMLRNGICPVQALPVTRRVLMHRGAGAIPDPFPGAFLDRVEMFDASFFSIAPREAVYMDPQQRILLEVTWQALEHAGQSPQALAGSKSGVFIGISSNDYARMDGYDPSLLDAWSGTGNAHSIAANRLSYVLDLHGPSLAVDTACSSSLSAVHLACQSLRAEECDLALAGGVNLILSPELNLIFRRAGMLSPDGRCKSFDASADGYGRAEGCGVVVLKRLTDALRNRDTIWAVILGSALNQDGQSNGLTAPNSKAQSEVISSALADARVKPEDVSYIEAHGSGTRLGDPIEMQALHAVYGASRTAQNPLLVGSVKSNLGHTEAAAGIAGLIKVILALSREVIPPNVHWKEPNPLISWDQIPITIPTQVVEWKPIRNRRIAGVSSFGFGGANAHVIVEGITQVQAPRGLEERQLHLLTLSAKDNSALCELAQRWSTALTQVESLADAAFTSNTGRNHLPERLTLAVRTSTEATLKLQAFARGETVEGLVRGHPANEHAPVCFLFPGQGSQYGAMASELYATQASVRRALDLCHEISRTWMNPQILDVLFGAEQIYLEQTAFVQPALFAVEYSIAKMWMTLGIMPEALIGHSVGEYVAACLAGVFSLEDGLRLICERGRLVQSLPGGGMAAVFESELRVAELLQSFTPPVSIAAINAPAETVISGDPAAIRDAIQFLRRQGIKVRLLRSAHAFHSALMDPVLDEFRRIAETVRYQHPQLTVISTLTGRLAGSDIASADYWVRQLRGTVRFADAVRAVDQNETIYLECGPQAVLLGMARRCVGEGRRKWLPSLRPPRTDWEQVFESLSTLYLQRMKLNWEALHEAMPRRRLALPTYPFQQRRYWLDPPRPAPFQPDHSIPQHSKDGFFHPFLGRRLASPLPEIQFTMELNPDQAGFLLDHNIGGRLLFPAAGWIEMMYVAGRQLINSVMIEELALELPLVMSASSPCQVHSVLKLNSSGAYEAEIYSLLAPEDSPSRWVRHVRGSLRSAADNPAAPCSSLEACRIRCGQRMNPESLYERMRSLQMDYGSSFRALQGIWWSIGEALGLIELPESLVAESADYQIHPILLDACFQLFAAAIPDDAESGPWVPVLIQKLTILHRPGSRVWGSVQLRVAADNTLTGDAQLFADDGTLLLSVENITLRRIASFEHSHCQEPSLYEVTWHAAVPSLGPSIAQKSKRQDWLIFADQLGIGGEIARRIEARGGRCVVVFADPHFCHGAGLHLDPQDMPGYQRLLNETLSDSLCSGVVHCWALDNTTQDSTDFNSLIAAQDKACRSILQLTQSARTQQTKPRLWVVTPNLGAVTGPAPVDLSAAPLCGLLRVIGVEHPELRCTRIGVDLDEHGIAESITDEVWFDQPEREVVFQNRQRFVPRLVDDEKIVTIENHNLPPSVRLELTVPGLLDSLALRPSEVRRPATHEVLIEVRAAGLNFRDVMIGLDLYPERAAIGGECAGLIVELGSEVDNFHCGQEVVALAEGCFSSFVIADARLIALKPPELTFEEAAGVPIAFLTTWIALNDLAGLQHDERVLIHAASGGVGVAAVQLARRARAQIFATASPSKWPTLRALEIHHLMNSRSLEFADEVLEQTGGRGVDVVLNCLSAEYIEHSLRVLAPGGRFVELGRRDIWDKERVAAYRKDIHYFIFNLARMAHEAPERVGSLLRKCMELLQQRELEPVPHTVFPMDSAVDAFRWMAQAKHTGKIVLSLPKALSEEPQPAQVEMNGTGNLQAPRVGILRPDVTYLIAGGLGALGMHVTRWMIEQGARHLLLLGRNILQNESRMTTISQENVRVVLRNVDLSDRQGLERVLHEMAENMPPLAGVMHLAGVLDDDLMVAQTWDRFLRVLTPKLGAWNLHLLTAGRNLDFFVLFSSVASLLGSPAQGSYAAANSFLDALAHYRRSHGLPALSINWGPWAGNGMAANWKGRYGLENIDPQEALAIFNHLIRKSPEHVSVFAARWPKLLESYPREAEPELLAGFRQQSPTANSNQFETPNLLLASLAGMASNSRSFTIATHISEQVRKILGLPPSEPLDAAQPLSELGLDSLMAVELKHALESMFDRSIRSDALLDSPSVNSLTELIVAEISAPSIKEASIN